MNRSISSAIIFLLISALLFPFFKSAHAGQAEYFNLESCVDYAKEHNLRIKSVQQEIGEIKGQSIEVMSVALPQLSFSGVYTKQQITAASSTDDDADLGFDFSSFGYNDEDEIYSAEFQLQQALFLGGQAIGAIQGASLTKKLYREKLRYTVNEVVAQVKAAYYAYLFAKENLNVREESLATLTRHYEIAETKSAVGVVSPFEVLRAEVEMANARPGAIQAKNAIRIAAKNLKLAMGMDYQEELLVRGELEYKPFTADLDELITQGLAERPDLKMAQLQEDINKKELIVNRAGFFPKLYFFYLQQSSKPNTHTFGGEDWDWKYSYGLNLTVPLFDGLTTYGKYYRSRKGIIKAQYDRLNIAELLKGEVQENYLNLRQAEEIILSQKKNIDLAEQGLKLAETRYESGLGTQTDVMDSQVALTAARTEYYQALLSYQTALAELIRSIGGRDPREN